MSSRPVGWLAKKKLTATTGVLLPTQTPLPQPARHLIYNDIRRVSSLLLVLRARVVVVVVFSGDDNFDIATWADSCSSWNLIKKNPKSTWQETNNATQTYLQPALFGAEAALDCCRAELLAAELIIILVASSSCCCCCCCRCLLWKGFS